MKHRMLILALALTAMAALLMALLTACGSDPGAAAQSHMAPSNAPTAPQGQQETAPQTAAEPPAETPAAADDASAPASTPAAPPAGGTESTASTAAAISTQQAVDIALEHARVSEADTSFLHTEQDYEHGRLVYEVEFYVGQAEYKYEIDAATGKILDMEMEHDH